MNTMQSIATESSQSIELTESCGYCYKDFDTFEEHVHCQHCSGTVCITCFNQSVHHNQWSCGFCRQINSIALTTNNNQEEYQWIQIVDEQNT